jgi:hypothetical protein
MLDFCYEENFSSVLCHFYRFQGCSARAGMGDYRRKNFDTVGRRGYSRENVA